MKIKISEVAKEMGITSKEVLAVCKELGISAKAAQSSISVDDAGKVSEFIANPPVKKEEKKEKVVSSNEKEEKKESSKSEKKEETPREKRRNMRKSASKTSSKNEKGGSLASMLKKDGGIKIVKKKRATSSISTDKEEVSKVATTTTKKKIKKKTPVEAIEKGKELEIDLGLGNMTSLEDNEVTLLDLSFNEIKMDLEDTPKKKQEQPKKKAIGTKKKGKKKRTISKDTTKKVYKKEEKTSNEPIIIKEETRVYELADKIEKPLDEVLEKLREFGEELDKNDFVNELVIETIADEFDVNVKLYNPIEEFDYVSKYDETPDNEDKLVTRPPIVTIMGHVDHGKTSLLDYIRNTKVTSSEAGGITQHIGAYMIEKDGHKITFLDTPGHAAFTEMRARGAKVTDIAIIVVAADDGVMPQTREAVNHAKEAGVPIIVAINKIDKETANPDRVTTQLSELGIMPVAWGGEYEFVNVSAHTGEGIDELLETINLQAEVLELKADPTRKAKAVVIESGMEKGRGAVATVIVENGTLKKGDSVVCMQTYGRVRTLINDEGKQLKDAKPGEPVQLFGLNDVPSAGDILVTVENDKKAREYSTKWKEHLSNKTKSKSTKATLEDLQAMMIESKIKKLPVVVRADTHGSAEAIKASLEELKNDEVRVNVLQSSVGVISENDVIFANTSENPAIILGFNVKPTTEAKNRAKSLGVEIKLYSIIYDLIDDITDRLSDMLEAKVTENNTGWAEVRELFKIPKLGTTIAGCMVMDGTIHRSDYARVVRDGEVIADSKLASLKRFKDDVKEVGKGFDCGIMIEDFDDLQVGDRIETYERKEEKAVFKKG